MIQSHQLIFFKQLLLLLYNHIIQVEQSQPQNLVLGSGFKERHSRDPCRFSPFALIAHMDHRTHHNGRGFPARRFLQSDRFYFGLKTWPSNQL